MGLTDKIREKADELTGKDRSGEGLDVDGHGDQTSTDTSETTTSITDALRDAGTTMKGDGQRPE